MGLFSFLSAPTPEPVQDNRFDAIYDMCEREVFGGAPTVILNRDADTAPRPSEMRGTIGLWCSSPTA